VSVTRPPLLTPDLLDERRAARRRARIRRRRQRQTVAIAVAAVLAAPVVVGGYRLARPLLDDPGPTSTPVAQAPARVVPSPVAATPLLDIGTAPVAPPGPIDRVLSYTPLVASGGTRKREVALTFDDGPSRYTPKIVSILRRAGAGGTFFVVGEEVGANTAALRKVQAAGFDIGDHTQTHARMTSLNAYEQRRQVDDQQAVVKGAGIKLAPLFRPPYGVQNRATRRLTKRKRMLIVMWSVDTSDYARPGVKAIVRRALAGATPGAIILLHDGGGDRSQTVAALPQILRGLEKKGLRAVTVSRLMADSPPPRRQSLPPANGG
jgi:peptidoglycan/xylan/chitin deacetylase (PgdA/CDA1 family)